MLIDMSNFIWPLNFSCTLVTENLILPNTYNIQLGIEPSYENAKIGLGFKRINYFIDNCLRNCILVSQDHSIFKVLDTVANNSVIFPIDPYDHFFGSVLFTKLSNITQKYFHIDFLTIDSAVGSFIQYTIVDPLGHELDLEGDHWWNSDSIYTGYGKNITWEELKLDDGPKFNPKIIKGGRSEE